MKKFVVSVHLIVEEDDYEKVIKKTHRVLDHAEGVRGWSWTKGRGESFEPPFEITLPGESEYYDLWNIVEKRKSATRIARIREEHGATR